jgi:hypothetical protein
MQDFSSFLLSYGYEAIHHLWSLINLPAPRGDVFTASLHSAIQPSLFEAVASRGSDPDGAIRTFHEQIFAPTIGSVAGYGRKRAAWQ